MSLVAQRFSGAIPDLPLKAALAAEVLGAHVCASLGKRGIPHPSPFPSNEKRGSEKPRRSTSLHARTCHIAPPKTKPYLRKNLNLFPLWNSSPVAHLCLQSGSAALA
jgi:hypothetical protein